MGTYLKKIHEINWYDNQIYFNKHARYGNSLVSCVGMLITWYIWRDVTRLKSKWNNIMYVFLKQIQQKYLKMKETFLRNFLQN